MSTLLAPDDPRHGTDNAYGNLGCRCDPCKEAHRVYQLARGSRYPHGTAARYSLGGCRCDACKGARTAYARLTDRGLKVPSTIVIDRDAGRVATR